MGAFTLDGIALDIPDACLSPQIARALDTGAYEGPESTALKRHLVPGDRMIDLGAGAGYLCCLAARITGGQNVLGVEGNPHMVPVARENLRRNGAKRAHIMHGAVVPDDFRGDTVPFMARQAFWGGGIDDAHQVGHPRRVDVPVHRIGHLMRSFEPTLVSMDIEGAEASLAGYAWPDHVRMVILEVHTSRYPAATLQKIVTGFFDAGFTYCPWGSRAETLVFERISERPH